MVIKVPRYTDEQIPQVQRRSGIKIDSSTVAQMHAADTIAGITVMTQLTNQYREVKAEGLASDKFNKWTEQMNAYDAELKSKSGSEAVGSIDKFSEKSNQVIGEFKFSNNFEQASFEDKIGVAKQAYDKSLLKHQATEAVSFNKQQQDGVMSSSLEGMVKASYTGDVATIDSNTVLYAQAFRAKHKGAPENWVAENIIKNISDGLSNSLVVFSQSNPAGALKAAKHLRHLDGEGSGRISEQQYRYVLQTAKKGYEESVATSFITNALESNSTKYKTVGEISGDESNTSKSAVPRTWTDTVSEARKTLDNADFSKDPYYGDISDTMKSEISTRFDKIVKRKKEERDAATDLIIDRGTEAINFLELNGYNDPKAVSTYKEALLSLKAMGEYKHANNLKNDFESKRITDYQAYSRADIAIDTGQLTSVTALGDLYGDKINSTDKATLTKKIRIANSAKVKNDMASAKAAIEMQLGKKGVDEGDIVEYSKQFGAAMSEFNRMYFNFADISNVTTEDVMNFATSALESEVGEELKQGNLSTIYDAAEDLYTSESGFAKTWWEMKSTDEQSIKKSIRDIYSNLRKLYGVTPTKTDVLRAYQLEINSVKMRRANLLGDERQTEDLLIDYFVE